MIDWAQNLLDLQDVDLRMAKISMQLGQLPGRMAEAATLYADEMKALEEAKASQKAAELACKKLETEISANQEKKRNFQSKTILIKNNDEYRAALLQIEACDTVIHNLEDQQLEAMEKVEETKPLVADKQKNVDLAKKRAEAVRDDLKQLKGQCEAQLAALRTEREEKAKAIEPQLLSQYEHKRTGRNSVPTQPCFVPIINDSCGRCRMSVTTQLCQDTKKGKLVTCPSCGAMLYAE